MVSVMSYLSTATMIGCPIPDDVDGRAIIPQPSFELVEKGAGVIAIAGTIMPDETLTVAKIISAIPVEPIFQRQAVAGYPIVYAFDRPTIA